MSCIILFQGNGEEEIIGCAWDGMTYIVDQKKNVVRYRFEEAVASFCAGVYIGSYEISLPLCSLLYLYMYP